jgi:DNA invertase Pin-like site-specific DNA recombinase
MNMGKQFNAVGSKQYGYARVSTILQKEDRQIIALKEFGVDDKNIFLDKVSGKDFNRPSYKRLLRKLRQGDTLVIKSIDRLGRDYNEIIEHWRKITKEIKAFVVVLDLAILDTRMKNEHDLTGVLISDVVLALFGYVSQMERENLLTRQAEGIAVAKEKGVRFGRPPRERPDDTEEYVQLYRSGKISLRKAAEALGVPKSTFEKWVKTDNLE